MLTVARTHIRAVSANEEPPPAPPKTITQAASSGTHRELLAAMRDRIAKAIEDPSCPPRDLASLSRRLHELSREIEGLDVASAQEVARRGEDYSDEAFDAAAL